MDTRTRLAADQLGRMRGMTRYYHQRFFSDIRTATLLSTALLVIGFWEVPEAFLLVPVVALIGACATAFDASYLIFSRHYATRLEDLLNDAVEDQVLVASELEETYLFPLDVPKIVTVPLDGSFTWFGFMTLLYTLIGAVTFAFGLALGLSTLTDHGGGWTVAYLVALGSITIAALTVGAWWFVGGEGERRLRTVLDEHFPGT